MPGGGAPLVLEHVVASVEADGRFEVRVRRQATEGDQRVEAVHQAPGMRIDTVYWHAPSAKRSVRGEERTQTAQGTSDLVHEMLDCRVA